MPPWLWKMVSPIQTGKRMCHSVWNTYFQSHTFVCVNQGIEVFSISSWWYTLLCKRALNGMRKNKAHYNSFQMNIKFKNMCWTWILVFSTFQNVWRFYICPERGHNVWKTMFVSLLVCAYPYCTLMLKGMEHIPNIFMSFEKYLFLEVITIFI